MSSPLILGWQEWIALPKLGLPALKAKIDTGAKTSALHTRVVEPYRQRNRDRVRFSVQPSPEHAGLQIEASAEVIDRREVRSSNGDLELRYVIASQLAIGERTWPIEITLANREQMTYRMLIGRQAIPPNVLIDPTASFRQPKLSFTLYEGM